MCFYPLKMLGGELLLPLSSEDDRDALMLSKPAPFLVHLTGSHPVLHPIPVFCPRNHQSREKCQIESLHMFFNIDISHSACGRRRLMKNFFRLDSKAGMASLMILEAL